MEFIELTLDLVELFVVDALEILAKLFLEESIEQVDELDIVLAEAEADPVELITSICK